MKTFLYFAYGSKMAELAEAHVRCLGPARLNDHRLAFTRLSERWGAGAADIVPASGMCLWGALFEVDEAMLRRLDQEEGEGKAYNRIEVKARCNSEVYDALAYEVIESTFRRSAPPTSTLTY